MTKKKKDYSSMNLKQIKEFLSKLTSTIDEEMKEKNELLLQFNRIQRNIFGEKQEELLNLYPNLLDPAFNQKIAKKKEFHDLTYSKEIKDVIRESDKLCNAEFELSPHQIFVRNFLSFLTPYNSLLLYHGLGTGKTCSAISVCEEMRDYMKQMGIKKKIIIVASPNVQENFKTQLFDERKLKETNGLWNLRSCTSNKFLKEINPMNMKGLTKDKVVLQVKRVIRENYVFMGYIEFSNYITRIKEKYMIDDDSESDKKRKIAGIKKEFSSRLIVIDEVHNIRISGDSPNKKVSENLMDMVKYTDTLKLLLMSATPMFNSYKEIIWLINLMNVNDGRPPIHRRDIFDKNGNFKVKDGKEVGKELLLQKMNGYVSFVRGENPYTFPYRIFPSLFDKTSTLKNPDFVYPRQQINGKNIIQGIDYLDIYLNEIGDYQSYGYEIALNELKENLPDEDVFDKGIGWQMVDYPLQTLNMVYPNRIIDRYIERRKKGEKKKEKINVRDFIGKNGLNSIMLYNEKTKKEFEYSPLVLDLYGRIFSPDNLSNYSMKLSNMIKTIKQSKGVVLIYSQYIDGGCVPIALALEEIGITRYNNKSLFKKKPTDDIDAVSMKTRENTKGSFKPAMYIMITGDKQLSPNNALEVKAATDDNNVNGEKVKVIIISRAGSEGIDFKNIRQTHIIEPWYNMSRIEQIIGRAVRFCSHKDLPFEERNVEIYLYGTQTNDNIEAVDLYVYRMAEKKAVKMGIVSRVMKENAVDCHLNIGINNLPVDVMNQEINLKLSSGHNIQYKVGDKPYTQLCDYMEKCDFKCKPDDILLKDKINMDTYNETFLELNTDKIVQKIKQLFKQHFLYKKEAIIKELHKDKTYPLIQINSALNYLIQEKNEFIIDMFGRAGNLINIDDYYMFQPIEITNKRLSRYQRSKPIDYKKESIRYTLKDDVKNYTVVGVKQNVKLDENIELKELIDTLKENYEIATSKQEIKRGETNWYINCYSTIERLTNMIDIDTMKEFVIHHIIDTLDFIKKKALIEYLLIKERNDFENRLFNYIKENNIFIRNGIKAVLLVKKGKLELYILKENKLVEAEPLDRADFSKDLLKLRYDKSKYNKIVGFMSEIQNKNLITLKIKDMMEKRNKGARCDQAGKNTNLKVLNDIYESEVYTKENTKKIKVPQLCIEQELILRFYEKSNRNKKKWFLTYEESVLNEIETITK